MCHQSQRRQGAGAQEKRGENHQKKGWKAEEGKQEKKTTFWFNYIVCIKYKISSKVRSERCRKRERKYIHFLSALPRPSLAKFSSVKNMESTTKHQTETFLSS